MKFVKYVLSVTIMLAAVSGVYAQSAAKHFISTGWGISVPTGDNQFIDKTSAVAPTIGYEFRFCPTLSVGLAVDYVRSTKDGEQSIRYGDGLATGYAEKELSMIPIRVQLRWFPLGNKEARLQPYVSIAGGAQFAKYNITGDQINTAEHKNWSGVITPDAGLRWFTGSSRKFFLDARLSWQWGGNSWETVDNNKNQQAFRVNLGAGVAF